MYLIILMPIILALSSLFFYILKPTDHLKTITTQDLLLAKEALLSYAATDTQRPGRMPCTGDDLGQAELFTRNVCPKNWGRLPWQTLDLAQHSAANAQPIGYWVDPQFTGDFPPQQLLNPQTKGHLYFIDENGVRHESLAAILFVPRWGVDLQALTPIDLRQNQWLAAVGISTEELFFATQKLVVQSVLACLKAHAQKAEVPAPAPFALQQAQSHPLARFGRVPQWAENEGISATIQRFAQQFNQYNWNPHDFALDPSAYVQALNVEKINALNESLFTFNAYAAQAFTAYQTLNQELQKLNKSANTLESTFARTLANKNETQVGRISASAQKNMIQNAQNVRTFYESVRQKFWQTGFSNAFDDFPLWEQAQQRFQTHAPLNKSVQNSVLWQSLWQWRKANELLRQWSADLISQTQNNAFLLRKMPNVRQDHADSLFAQSQNVRSSLAQAQKSLAQFQEKETAARRKKMLDNFEKFSLLFNQLKTKIQESQPFLKGEKAHFWPVLWQSAQCDFFQTWWEKDGWQAFVFYQNHARINGQNVAHVVIASGAALPGQNQQEQHPLHYFEDCNAHPSRADFAENPTDLFCVAPRSATFNDVLAWSAAWPR